MAACGWQGLERDAAIGLQPTDSRFDIRVSNKLWSGRLA